MLNFIEKLKNNRISIWADGDSIELSYGEEQPAANLIETIRNEKSTILDFLHSNKIYSQLIFNQFGVNKEASYVKKTEINKPSEIEVIYQANSLQQGFIYHHLSQPHDDAYRIQLLLDYHDDLNIEAYQQAWRLASIRYPVLRMAFDWGEEVLQVISAEPGISEANFDIKDVSKLAAEKRDAAIVNIQKQERKIPFDLTRPGLVRFTIIKQHARLFTVLKTEHHSVSDGWSSPILLQTVHQYYQSLINDNTPQVQAETAYLAAQVYYAKQRHHINAYWEKTKQRYISANDINGLLSHSIDLSQARSIEQPSEQSLIIEGAVFHALKRMCQQEGVTLNVALQFAWHKLLHVYTQDEQTIVGTTVSGRDIPIEGIESSVGLYINTLPLAVDWCEQSSCREVLSAIHQDIASLNSYSSISLASLQTDGERLFHSLFVFENYPLPVQENGQQARTGSRLEFRHSEEKTDYPITVIAYEVNNQLTLNLQYSDAWLNDTQVNRLLNQLQKILESISENIEQPHQAISLLAEQERETLLYAWNKADIEYPRSTTLHDLFEQQVKRTPNNIALVYGGEKLSYRELNEHANQLARALRENYQSQTGEALKADTFIGLYLDRSLEMVISILAVLKAGGTYVPISPEYPQGRVQFILEDTAASVVITQQQCAKKLSECLAVLEIMPSVLIADDSNVTASRSIDNLESVSDTGDLAYVIYTSGTTGQPKGVLQPHHNVLRLFASTQKNYQFDQNDTWVLYHAYSFDFTVWELWGALLYGGQLIVPTEECIRDFPEFVRLCAEYQVSVLNQTPAAFNAFSDAALKNHIDLPHLRYVVFGGDKLNLAQLKPWWDAYGDEQPRLVNMYGITETTVHVTYKALSIAESIKASLIGRPLDDMSAYVLNEQMQPVPIGAPGELYIGGAGLARGYLNRPELTEERFINNPFSTAEDKTKDYTRLYKTGDVVRWLDDGSLEYLGRNDSQVKIRGYRIELGEIESALSKFAGIKQAVVISKDREGEKYLAAYFVGHTNDQLDTDDLREKLSLQIPAHMLPSTFTQIESVPLNVNGKLDRQALPEPEFVNVESYVAPLGELEQKLCAVWRSVLGLEQIGTHDNFFRIGGDSIVSIQLVSKLRQAGFNLQVKAIFEAPTVAQLARLLNETVETQQIQTEQGLLTGSFDLLPIQQWFFDQQLANPHHWNQAFMVKIPGSILISDIEQSLFTLTGQHDMLRCNYVVTEKGYEQNYNAAIEQWSVPLQSRDISGLDKRALHEALSGYQSGLNYHDGPLWQVVYLHGYADGSARLMFALHHLIVDAVSWRIIAEDIQQLLNGQQLLEKSSSYRQWVSTIQRYATHYEQEKYYWSEVLEKQTALPTPEEIQFDRVSLSAGQTNSLLSQANEGYHTEINDLLLSALSIALTETLGHSENHITLEGHGRETIDTNLDVSKTVGWFTSMYPVELVSEETLDRTIIRTKEMLRSIPNKGVGYGALKQSGLVSGSLPRISFNYLGQLGGNVQAKEDNYWQLVGESCGQQIGTGNGGEWLLNINGAVRDGVLTFDIVSRLSVERNSCFVKSLEAKLIAIINQGQLMAKVGGVKTPSDYAVNDLSIPHLKSLQQRYRIEALYPANSLQQGFIYHHLSQAQDDAYRVQVLIDYHTEFDIEVYQQAWRLASIRYPSLRIAFDWSDGLLQVISSEPGINENKFTIIDISEVEPNQRDAAIVEIQRQERTKPFDLSEPGLIRFTIIKQDDQLFTVLKTEHHSISDGWSGSILLQTVHAFYSELIRGRMPKVEQETAYLEAQEYYLKQQKGIDAYWDKAKQKYSIANDINLLLSQSINLSESRVLEVPGEQSLIIKGDLYDDLKQLCRGQGITLNVAVQFVWHKLLNIYTRDEQTIVGTTVSGRDIPVKGVDKSVGLYINTLPLAVSWDGGASIQSVLKAIQQDIAALNSYSSVSLADLQSDGERLFHSLFIFENYPVPINEAGKNAGSKGHLSFRGSVEKMDYPIAVLAYEGNNNLVIQLKYGEAWLSELQAKRLLGQMHRIVEAITINPKKSHHSISILDQEERGVLLGKWNKNHSMSPQETTIHHLFEQQVEKTPDNIALVYEGWQLNYRELNEKANQLARVLRENYQSQTGEALKADALIGLYLNRSLEMVISILAVLKAGGAYVPISPEYPQDRVQYILEDTQLSILITQQDYAQLLKDQVDQGDVSCDVLVVDDVSVTKNYPTTNPKIITHAQDLAYVIYTSGTTGQPKGVMVENGTLAGFIQGIASKLSEEVISTWSLTHYTFDIFGLEFATPLITGGRVILSDITPTYENLNTLLAEVNVIQQTPSVWKTLLTEIDQGVDLSHIQVLVGGESGSSDLYDQLSNHFDSVIQVYGPTETCIWSTSNVYQKGQEKTIGRPLQGESVYVLNDELEPVSIGVSGELYIGGLGLARGYLNRPELTAERFIDNSFAFEEDKVKGYGRLYKTGDIVRWLANGNLEYLGRNDSQVKIRGYRIELGEIESALTELNGVKQAVVVDKDRNDDKFLVAYLVSESNDDFSSEKIKEKLSEILPIYMLPDSIVQIDFVPLTINGKLDHRNLPEPDFASAVCYVAPRNKLEKEICRVWQEVLGLDQVGVYDNFFRIGGNSIAAIQLIGKSRRELELDIPLALIFEQATVAGLVAQLDEQALLEIPVVQADRYPLSFAQQRLLFIERYEQGTDAYHIPLFVRLDSGVNLEALESACNIVIDHHPVLKSIYLSDDQANDYQVVSDESVDIQVHILANEDELSTALKADLTRPFNLVSELSIRLRCYVVGDIQYLLILWHHIGFDGWSTNLFLSELSRAYQSLCNNQEIKLPELSISYADYAHWQREYLQGEVLERLLNYWRNELQGADLLQLPTDYPRPAQVDYRGRDYRFELSAELSEQLRILAKNRETTLYTVMLSAFYMTLANLSGQQDILIGTPSDNRQHAQTQSLIGFFVNSLALRVVVNPEENVESLISEVHRTVMQGKVHQELPFEHLVDILDIERDPSRHPLYQILFTLDKVDKGSKADVNLPFRNAGLTQRESIYCVAKFDLSLFLQDSEPKITGWLNYAVSLFEEATIARMVDVYKLALQELVSGQLRSVAQVDLLLDEERQLLLHTWNDTDAAYPQDKTLHQLFEDQVEKAPNNVAIIHQSQQLTYFELSEKVNGLLCLLRNDHSINESSQWVGQSGHDGNDSITLVGVLSEKGYQQVAATLAIMKSGAGYIPLHVEWPVDRIDEVLEQGKVTQVFVSALQYETLIKDSHLVDAYEWLIVESATEVHPAICHQQSLPTVNVDDIAYVIFTSGSTGKPKGVTISHRNAVNTLLSVNDRFSINSSDRVLALSELSFDLSVYDIFGVLAAGGAIVFPEQAKTKDPAHWYQLIQQHQVTIWDTVPQLMQLLVDHANDNGYELSGLKVVLMSGDWIPLSLPTQIKTLDSNTIVMSLGGATEGSVWSIWHEVDSVDPSWNSIPYGRAMPNQKMYVLSEYGEPSPIGVIGEIHIGGVGVAQCYWGDDEKTRASFIQHKKLGRLYKTGDMGRWNKVGYIEFEGRKDNQVKIHGYRIELGEIESALNVMAEIKQAIVIDKEQQGSKYLVAYVVTDSGKPIVVDDIRKYLSVSLPDYMIPAVFTRIDSIPLTVNGKLDRKELPEPEFADIENYVAPRDELEQKLCTVWESILGLKQVGIHDNFFRIGGDSIISIQLVSKLRQVGLSLQVKAIFEAPTVAQLARFLIDSEVTHQIEAEQGLLTGRFNLLPIQQWFFDQHFTNSHYWNQAFMVKVPGDVLLSDIDQALIALTSQHDMLRCSFVAMEQGYEQNYNAESAQWLLPLQSLNVSGLGKRALHEALSKYQHGFNYHDGPLWQAVYLHGYADGSARLMFALHHLIVDAVSWRIIAEDIQLLLSGQELPEKSSSYRQWVRTIQNYAVNHEQEKDYWIGVLDKHTALSASEDIQYGQVSLSAEQTSDLLSQANQGYRTEINDLLLSALSIALTETLGGAENHITLEGHGREAIDTRLDVSKTVGWFTSVYPVELVTEKSLDETIIRTKEMLRSIPNKGVGYGALSQSGLVSGKLPRISFNYLGQLGGNVVTSEKGYWQLVGEGCGQQVGSGNGDDWVLSINGAARDGVLTFNIGSRLSAEQSNCFAKALEAGLIAIVNQGQLMAKGGGVKTPSDYAVGGLSVSDLKRLQSSLKKEVPKPPRTSGKKRNKLKI